MATATKETKAEARRRESRERLEAAVRQFATTDGWKKYLSVRRRFHRYSFNNQILILLQKPEATQVTGYKTWKSLDRQVRKGEKSIQILAPRTWKKEDEETGEKESGVYFVPVPVFDISQTDGEPLPELPGIDQGLESDPDMELDRLRREVEEFARGRGTSVGYGDLSGEMRGYFAPAENAIVVQGQMGPLATLKTLVHEVAHSLGVDYIDYSREDSEVIVEGATAMALGSLGIEVSGDTLAYLASWGHGSDFEAFQTHAKKMHEIAGKLEEALGVEEEGA